MQLRYSFRLYPNGPQRSALARAFGCARVVFNDALRIRKDAHEQGKPYPKIGDLSKQVITEAKKTEERSWLGEVSAVVLQQSLRDLDTAYFQLLRLPQRHPQRAEVRRAPVQVQAGQPTVRTIHRERPLVDHDRR